MFEIQRGLIGKCFYLLDEILEVLEFKIGLVENEKDAYPKSIYFWNFVFVKMSKCDEMSSGIVWTTYFSFNPGCHKIR